MKKNRIKPIKDYKGLCFKCLQKKSISTYSIYRNEYGSSFDNNHTKLQICEDCKPKGIDDWFNEESETEDNCCYHYKYEVNIIDFVNTFPIQGQELFWNRCASGACADTMGSRDWIDMELGIMTDERYEELGYCSPRQKRAYKENFPICQHPVNRIWNDNSKGCWCPFGASGKYGQKCDEYNISDECYKCQYFTKRITPIKDILDEDYRDYEIYYIAKLNQEKYKNRFETN